MVKYPSESSTAADDDPTTLQGRLTDLETRYAFQEDTIEQLNTVVIQQRQQMERLQQLVLNLKKAVVSSANSDVLDHEPPPHY